MGSNAFAYGIGQGISSFGKSLADIGRMQYQNAIQDERDNANRKHQIAMLDANTAASKSIYESNRGVDESIALRTEERGQTRNRKAIESLLPPDLTEEKQELRPSEKAVAVKEPGMPRFASMGGAEESDEVSLEQAARKSPFLVNLVDQVNLDDQNRAIREENQRLMEDYETQFETQTVDGQVVKRLGPGAIMKMTEATGDAGLAINLQNQMNVTSGQRIQTLLAGAKERGISQRALADRTQKGKLAATKEAGLMTRAQKKRALDRELQGVKDVASMERVKEKGWWDVQAAGKSSFQRGSGQHKKARLDALKQGLAKGKGLLKMLTINSKTFNSEGVSFFGNAYRGIKNSPEWAQFLDERNISDTQLKEYEDVSKIISTNVNDRKTLSEELGKGKVKANQRLQGLATITQDYNLWLQSQIGSDQSIYGGGTFDTAPIGENVARPTHQSENKSPGENMTKTPTTPASDKIKGLKAKNDLKGLDKMQNALYSEYKTANPERQAEILELIKQLQN